MGYLQMVVSIIAFLFLAIPTGFANETTPSTDVFSIELLYTHFESRYTPRDLLHKAQKEAVYITGEFKKSREAGMATIEEFNTPFTRWNHMDGLFPFSQIHLTEKGMIVAHPNPSLHKLLNVEYLAQKFKDHSGRMSPLEGIKKVDGQPEGVWVVQFTTWIRSRTHIATPLFLLNVFVRIPETPYHVSTVMPYRLSSLEEADKTVEYLDAMTPYWSIIK